MNIRPLESLSKAELIDLIRHEREQVEQIGAGGVSALMPGRVEPIPLLAKKHTGMMVDYMGLIGQARAALKHGEKSPALAEMLNQLSRNIKELGEGWYSGDTSIVDEFLQLYCVEDDARRRIEEEQS